MAAATRQIRHERQIECSSFTLSTGYDRANACRGIVQTWMLAAIRTGGAFSGLLLVVFLLIHLAGLVPVLVAPGAFEHYAEALHNNPWLPLVETGLMLTALVHISLTLIKTLLNRRAGNGAALRSRRDQTVASVASRSKVIAGLVSLVFLVVHLGQLRFPRPAAGQERELLIQVLHQPLNLALYGLASLAIGLHLLHGTEAAHRSLGWLTPMNKQLLRRGGQVLAAISGAGFLLLSLVLGGAA